MSYEYLAIGDNIKIVWDNATKLFFREEWADSDGFIESANSNFITMADLKKFLNDKKRFILSLDQAEQTIKHRDEEIKHMVKEVHQIQQALEKKVRALTKENSGLRQAIKIIKED